MRQTKQQTILAVLDPLCTNRQPRPRPPAPRPLLIINHITRELNINHMRSKHTHKIGFQSKVYSKQHRLKGQNMPKCRKRKAKMVLKSHPALHALKSSYHSPPRGSLNSHPLAPNTLPFPTLDFFRNAYLRCPPQEKDCQFSDA